MRRYIEAGRADTPQVDVYEKLSGMSKGFKKAMDKAGEGAPLCRVAASGPCKSAWHSCAQSSDKRGRGGTSVSPSRRSERVNCQAR